MKLKPIAQQTIVITGATSGIGLATARLAAQRGARVVLVARDEAALAAVADAINIGGGNADHVAADVGNRDQVRAVADRVVERHGGFDSWVNCAGVGVYARLTEISDADHRKVFETNYWGVVHGSTEAARHLKGTGGAIINIGSVVSDMPTPMLSSYAASKHAVKGFTDSLRAEFINDGVPISVTLIKPSGADTPFVEHAGNYMGAAAALPPPIYAPELVAEAILTAAQHRRRSIVVGGAGKLQTLLAGALPALSDQIIARTFAATAIDRTRPPQDGPGLHEPGSYGETRGRQGGWVRETSVYTALRRNPVTAAAGVGLGVAALGAALIGRKVLGSRGSKDS